MSTTSEPAPSSGDHSTVTPDKYVLLDKYKTLSRLYDYSLVHGAVNTSVNWYNYAKGYTIFRKPMELSEATVGLVAKPILDVCDPLINYADDFTVDKIDKIETTVSKTKESITNYATPYKENAIKTISKTITTVDSTLENVIDFGQEKLSGTPISDLVGKSITSIESLAENVVDTILPPPEGENISDTTDMYLMEKRFPVIYKLRKRVNYDSVKEIPGNTYTGIVQYTSVKPISYLVAQLQNASKKISSMNLSDVRDEVSKKTIDQIYVYLDTTAASIGNLSLWFHRFDPNEVLISISELMQMIKDSKNQILNMQDQKQKVQKFKEDCSSILSKAGSLLQQQIDSGLAKVEEWKKSDRTVIRTTIVLVEQAVHNILQIIPNILLHPADLIELANGSYQENSKENSSSNTPNNDSSSSTPSTSPSKNEESES